MTNCSRSEQQAVNETKKHKIVILISNLFKTRNLLRILFIPMYSLIEIQIRTTLIEAGYPVAWPNRNLWSLPVVSSSVCFIDCIFFSFSVALTTWSCVSPKTAIMITIPFPVLWLVFYAILDKSYISNEPQGAHKRTEIKYTSLKNSPEESANRPKTTDGIFSCTEQLRIAFKILPFILSLFLSFFAEYLSNSSVITSIAFPDSKLHPRDHFLVYFLSYMLGKFVGRSHLFIFSFLPPKATEFLMCDKTWIFAGWC